MPAPGRNDPCPCGSGKKYKQCCLSRAQAATGITPADRDEVSAALMRYARRPEWDEVVADAALMWMGDDPDADPRDALEDIFSLDTSRETFFDWLFYDLPLEDRRTVADTFLDRHARSLNPRALDYLRLMQGTCLRAWQVRSVQPGTGMTLRDLWSNDEVTISERSASRQVVIWDILVARVVGHADGSHQLEGPPCCSPPQPPRPSSRASRPSIAASAAGCPTCRTSSSSRSRRRCSTSCGTNWWAVPSPRSSRRRRAMPCR